MQSDSTDWKVKMQNHGLIWEQKLYIPAIVLISSIFDKCSLLESWSNHTFHTKVYFNEFVANALRDNMGMIILTSDVLEAVRGPKYHILIHTLAL